MFNVHIQSTSTAVPLSRTRNKKEGGIKGVRGGGGTACTSGYRRVRAVRPESVAGGGWFEVLWNLECPVGLSQRAMCAHLKTNYFKILADRQV